MMKFELPIRDINFNLSAEQLSTSELIVLSSLAILFRNKEAQSRAIVPLLNFLEYSIPSLMERRGLLAPQSLVILLVLQKRILY